MASTVAMMRLSSGGRKPMMGSSSSEASRSSVLSCWRKTPRDDTSLARTSALILSAPARHFWARLVSPRSSARSAPRAAATQHITLDAEVLGRAADLPDPLIGFVPVLQGVLDEAGEP